MNDNDDSSSSGNGNGDTAVDFIADVGTRIIPGIFADWIVQKSVSDTRSNVAASAVLSSGGNDIGNINGTNNINAEVAIVVVDDDDDDSDSDSDTDDDMPELEECRHINNRSRHIIGNRRMFVSRQFTITRGTDHGFSDEENQSDSSEEPAEERPQ